MKITLDRTSAASYTVSMEKTIERLNKLARATKSLEEFFNEIKKWPKTYGVSMWNKTHYEAVYNKQHGGR